MAQSLLPPAAYFDHAWFDGELDTVFAGRWVLAAGEDELSGPGDYACVTVGRAPLVVVRAEDGELRAFHNLCRHRGMVMLDGAGHVDSTISCFYHEWRYRLDGSLKVVPQRAEHFGDLDLAHWGLRTAGVAVWEGMVFVHPDPEAPPFAESLDGVADHLGSHRPGRLRQAAVVHIDAACNWKLFVENHVDVYHLWYLHAASLGGFDHTKFEYHQTGPNWASYEPRRPSRVDPPALRTGTVPIGHLAERDRDGIGAHLLFPNLMIATSAEFFATYVAQPVAPERCQIELRIRTEPGADPDGLVAALRSFIDEDVAACEAVQRGVRSPWFEVGPLGGRLEAPVSAFQESVLAALR